MIISHDIISWILYISEVSIKGLIIHGISTSVPSLWDSLIVLMNSYQWLYVHAYTVIDNFQHKMFHVPGGWITLYPTFSYMLSY